MKSNLIYRASFYVMLTVATTIVCGDKTDSRLDSYLPLGVAAAGIIAFLTVDRTGRWGLPRELANLLALLTLVVLFFEYRVDENQVIRALGHWTIYLQLIKFFLPKTAEDDWFLFLLGLTQVLIGSVTNQGDMVGAWLFFWAMLAVWVLGLFFLQREASRFRAENLAVTGSKPRVAADPYHGLFDIPYLASSLRVLALTLLLGGLFFLLLPRQAGATRARPTNTMTRHISGFDEEVKLGQLGEILENDSVVMSVEFTDWEGRSAHPGGEPLWRGVPLTQYENGRWRRGPQGSHQLIVSLKIFKNTGPKPRTVVRQLIKLEANDSSTLFAMRPILELSSSSGLPPAFNPIDGSIARQSPPRGNYEYEVLSDSDAQAPQEEEAPPSDALLHMLLDMDPGLKGHLRKIALPLVKDLPGVGPTGITARSLALESYLRDSRVFGYTLEMKVVDPTIDPVEDFLLNRKKGHCEYFASALALLLRSLDIPARMVNGFKGGDWNDLTRSMNVRQKHAHSWVEAYLGQDDPGNPLWLILDPTPGADRDESVAQVGGIGSAVRPITDLFRYIWVFYILGYDSSRQNRLLYTPLAITIREVRKGYATIWSWTKSALALLFDFKTIGSFISLRGFFVTFILGSLVVLIVKLAAWAIRRLVVWWRGPTEDEGALTAGILFYRRLAQLLSGYELLRTPAETQKEFALRASRFLTTQGPRTQAVAGVPEKIVRAFYQVRFGHQDLDQDTLLELEQDLDLLQSRLGGPEPGIS
jgi:transglutaminase-like putative cysteine protease